MTAASTEEWTFEEALLLGREFYGDFETLVPAGLSQAAMQVEARRLYRRELWAECEPLDRNAAILATEIVPRYLGPVSLDLPTPPDLRRSPGGGLLIVAIRNARGELVSVRRHDSAACDYEAGAAIRLQPTHREPLNELIVCEGLDTGLALYQLTGGKAPVWVSPGAGLLAAMQFPAETRRVVVAGAYSNHTLDAPECALREFLRRGLQVHVIWPHDPAPTFAEELESYGHDKDGRCIAPPMPREWWRQHEWRSTAG